MRVVAFLIACGVAASTAVALAAGPAGPNIVFVGPLAGPNGAATASGSVGPAGQADACVNDQHSGTSPSSSDPNGATQLNDRSCASSSQTGGGGGASGASAQSAGSKADASSAGASKAGSGRAKEASLGRAKIRTTVVMARQARGLRIGAIRFATRGIATTKRLGVLVTVRDGRGYLVRDAIVSIAGVRGAHATIAIPMATYTNGLGRASFRLPVGAKLSGKRLLVTVTARTPRTQTHRVGAVRLPKLAATKA